MDAQRKIAFVIPWYADDGAYAAGDNRFVSTFRHTVTALHTAGHRPEVVTTTIHPRDEGDFRNHFEAGETLVDGVPVHRFPIGARRGRLFQSVYEKVTQRLSLTEAELDLFLREFMPLPEMLNWIHRHRSDYLFFFVSFLHPSTFLGLKVVNGRGVLIPGYRDNLAAFHPLYAMTAESALGIIFQSKKEQSDLIEAWELSPRRDQLMGIIPHGEDLPEPPAELTRYSARKKIVVSVDRLEEQSAEHIQAAWSQLQKRSPHSAELQLLVRGGHGAGEERAGQFPNLTPHVSILSMLDRSARARILTGADLVWVVEDYPEAHPDMVLAWGNQTPVLVNGACPIQVEHCRQGHAGLYYIDPIEFAATFTWLAEHPHAARQMGENGRKYLASQLKWSVVVKKYIQLAEDLFAQLGP